MKFGKLENNRLVLFKNPIRTGSKDTFTNDSNIITQNGFKEVVYTEPPEIPEGFYAEPHWAETDTEIVQEWELVPLPLEEATDEDYLEALTEMGVNLND